MHLFPKNSQIPGPHDLSEKNQSSFQVSGLLDGGPKVNHAGRVGKNSHFSGHLNKVCGISKKFLFTVSFAFVSCGLYLSVFGGETRGCLEEAFTHPV